MPKKTSLLLASFFIVLCLSFVSASLGAFEQNQCLSIRVLANCSSINLVEVTNNATSYIINSPMTNLGGQTFNYTFCNTSSTGSYSYSWNNPCVDCSQGNCGNDFLVTVTGKEFTAQQSTTYFLIFIVSLCIFIGLLWMGIALPGDNQSDEMTGYIIAVSNIKYLKMVILGFSYLVAMFISYFIWNVSYNYLDIAFMTTIFRFISTFLTILVFPFFILLVWISIANIIRDAKIGDLLSRGIKTNGK